MSDKISECNDIKFLRDAVIKLWAIIDDIDTYGDMAKSDNELYRALVEKRQKERWDEVDIVSDGYDLYKQ